MYHRNIDKTEFFLLQKVLKGFKISIINIKIYIMAITINFPLEGGFIMDINKWLYVCENDKFEYSSTVYIKIEELITLYIEQLHVCLDIEKTSDSREFIEKVELKKDKLDYEDDNDYAILYFIEFIEKEAINIFRNVIKLDLIEHSSMISKLDFLLDTIKAEINWKDRTQDSTIICLLNEISDLDTTLNRLNHQISQTVETITINEPLNTSFDIKISDLEYKDYINFYNFMGQLDENEELIYNPVKKTTGNSLLYF